MSGQGDEELGPGMMRFDPPPEAHPPTIEDRRAVLELERQALDAELETIRELCEVLEPLEDASRRRVLRWALDRYGAG